MKQLLLALVMVFITMSASDGFAGSVKFAPPSDYTEDQKGEWWVGLVAGLAPRCGFGAEGREIKEVIKASPYARKGISKASFGDKIQGCGKIEKIMKNILDQLDEVKVEILNKYGCGGSSCN